MHRAFLLPYGYGGGYYPPPPAPFAPSPYGHAPHVGDAGDVQPRGGGASSSSGFGWGELALGVLLGAVGAVTLGRLGR